MPPSESSYDIRTEVRYAPGELIDLPADIAANEGWFNEPVVGVNDSVVRLAVAKGEFHWHKHDQEDEFFLVLEGALFIDIEGEETVELGPHQGYTVPKGTVHRTRATQKTAILMVEQAGAVPTGS